MRRLLQKLGGKTRAIYNVNLRVDESPPESHSLPYVGEFTVLKDRRLVRGPTTGVVTYSGLVDMAGGPPLHVDFDSGLGEKYLVRKGRDYYLRDNALEVTPEVVETTRRLAGRFST